KRFQSDHAGRWAETAVPHRLEEGLPHGHHLRLVEGAAFPNFGRFERSCFSLGGSMADILAIALVTLGLSAGCSAIIIFKLNRHQRTQQASFEENLLEVAYHLATIRRGETLRSEVTSVTADPSDRTLSSGMRRTRSRRHISTGREQVAR